MYSQAEEDETLERLLVQQGITVGTFVEIGVGWGNQNNTLALAHRGWKGWWLGEEPLLVPVPETVTFTQVTVTPDNVLELLKPVTPPIDVFSLDIDGNDYWVGDVAIPWLRPKIVVVEYFSERTDHWIMENTPGFRWYQGMPHSATLQAWVRRFKSDYELVAVTKAQVNAFFVRSCVTV